MDKDINIQHLIDRPEPSELFLKARQFAGSQLQSQFSFFNNKTANSSYDGFKWIKAELSYPSFDNLTFAYKNAVFSVVIELIDDANSSFTQQQKDRLLIACEENNLTPCLFKIHVKEMFQGNYELASFAHGWNLYDAITNDKIDPFSMSSDKKIMMSSWELSNFAIQIVKSSLQEEGHRVLSFCDLPEVNPQIWFKDAMGNVNWVIAKYNPGTSGLSLQEWAALIDKNPLLKPYNGFFAQVKFHSHSSKSSIDLFRGDEVIVSYEGLDRIYTP